MAGNVNLLWSRRWVARGAGSGTRESSVETARNSHEFRYRRLDNRGEVASPANEISEPASGARSRDQVTAAGVNRTADEWIERTVDPAGGVVCRGQSVAHFAAGQSVAIVHIPFVPAFDCVPEFSCEVVDDPSIRSRTPAVYRYGARVELRFTGAISTAIRGAIRFEARAAAQSSRAA
jgi:hypothetical protein